MKNLSSRFLPLLAAMLLLVFFAACEKDEVDTRTQTQIPPTTTTIITSPVVSRLATNGVQAQSSSSTTGLEIDCISVDYPFDFNADGVVTTMVDEADVIALFTSGQQFQSLDFVYPLNVTLEDGSTTVAADASELSALVSACVPTTGWGTGSFPAFFFDDANCISLSYPVDLTDMDGNTVSAADEMAYVNLIASNPGLSFVFPLSVADSSGVTVAVADVDALFDILVNCSNPGTGPGTGSGPGTGQGGGTGHSSILLGEGCFDYNYPVNLIDFDGNVVSVMNDNDFSVALLNGDFFDFEYSFSVTLEADGSQVTIADQDDFVNLLGSCISSPTSYGVNAIPFIGIAMFDSCYALVFPFDIDVDGVNITINNAADAQTFVDGQQFGDIVFPVDVTQGGQLVTLTDAQAYFGLVESCTGTGTGPGPGPGAGLVTSSFYIFLGLDVSNCYTLVYPFSITDIDGNVTVIASETEATAHLDSNNEGFVQFPVDVIDTSTGNTVTLADEFELFMLLDNCQ